MYITSINWPEILPHFGISPEYLINRHGPCPICGGKDRFRFDNKEGSGSFICNHCGAGTGLKLVQLYTGLARKEIRRKIALIDGRSIERPHLKNVSFDDMPKDMAEKNAKKLNEAWKQSLRLSEDDPVTRYLCHRVPEARLRDLVGNIRYHPGMKYMVQGADGKMHNAGAYPVMLARVVNAAGITVTLHRTYLTAEGRKAPFEKVKKLMSGVGRLNGAAIRLNHVPQSRCLGICEGIETALAVMTAYKNRINVWSLVNAGNMAKADIPAGRFDRIIIFADHDKLDSQKGYRPGEHFARLLQERLEKDGLSVTVKQPRNEGSDFADVWLDCCQMK